LFSWVATCRGVLLGTLGIESSFETNAFAMKDASRTPAGNYERNER
jgi:hypothetical protein